MIIDEDLQGKKPRAMETKQIEQATTPSEKELPIIGIPLPVQQGRHGPLLIADAVGAWAIERSQGRVLLIPLWPFPTHIHMYHSLWPLIDSIDGLLLPAALQEGPSVAHWQAGEDGSHAPRGPLSWDIALAQLATYIGMPLLAIADGAEQWNRALGGEGREPSEDAIPTSPNPPHRWDRQRIRVRDQSTLAGMLQPALAAHDGTPPPWELPFLSTPGVRSLAPGLRSCAQLEDGTVVAFERRDAAFGLGIIGRLDWGLDQVYGTLLFEAFLSACRLFATTRQHNRGWESSRETICATLYHLVTHHQPLLSVPSASSGGRRRAESLAKVPSSPLASSIPTTGSQERLRQRSPLPTKEELNRMRRQRRKVKMQ